MSQPITLQDWVTVCGSSAGDVVLQRQEFYANVAAAAKVVVRVDIMKLSDVNLNIQTAKVADKKYWRTTKSPTVNVTYVLTRDSGQTAGFLENLLRWQLYPTGANWQATFRIQLYLK